MKKSLQLVIKSLQVHLQSELDGDELFLKLGKNRIWPRERYFKCKPDNSSIRLDLKIPWNQTDQQVEVELWEFDNLILSSKLGEFVLIPDVKGGPFVTDLKIHKNNFAKYSLIWEVQ